MKNMKKILALLVAVLMIAASMAAVAEVPTSQTVKSDNAADENGQYTISTAKDDTHTYTVYQILTGSLIAGQNKLGDPQWGSDAKSTGKDGVSDFIESLKGSNTEINAKVEAQLKEGAAGVGSVSASSSLAVVPGYYLIKDTTARLEDGDAYSLNIVAVFNDIQITPKKGTTTSEKHVNDVNDTNGAQELLKDSADYDIGDEIPYTLTFTLPADYANYEKYYVEFHDDMSAGLTYKTGSAQIKYGSADAVSLADPTSKGTSAYEGGTVWNWEIEDLKTTAPGMAAGQTITITYKAVLNGTAKIGADGNPNKYRVTYSNNPNNSGKGQPTGDTPWDVNIVFTYKTVFNKVDAENNPLTGADFKLEKKVGDNWVDVTALHNGEGAINPVKTGDTTGTQFTFAGLDDGDYKLTETVTPDGYNTIDPIEFTITATHDLVSADPKLTDLTGTDGHDFTMTKNVSAGELDKAIVNRQGSTLPSTGGIGTTLFYIGGGILVLAAVILLVTKRRMNAGD